MGLEMSKGCCDVTKISGKRKKFSGQDFSVSLELCGSTGHHYLNTAKLNTLNSREAMQIFLMLSLTP